MLSTFPGAGSTSWGSQLFYYTVPSSRPFWYLPNSGLFSNLNVAASPDTYYMVMIVPNTWNPPLSCDFRIGSGSAPTGDAEAPKVYMIANGVLGGWTEQVGAVPAFSWVEKVWGSDAGKICNASAQYSNDGRYTGYFGTAQQSINAAATGRVATFGISPVHVGLSVGSSYYLSNTAGSISLTPGTNSRTVGRSISSTQLLLGS